MRLKKKYNPKTSYIGLISALPFEAGLLLRKLNASRLNPPQHTSVTGIIGGKHIAYIASGIGIANAAHSATLLIEGFSPRLIINFGIAGAYPSSGLNIGDIAVAEKEIYADTGILLKNGFHPIRKIAIPLLKKDKKSYFNEFQLDKNMIKKTLAILPETHAGTFLTVSASTGTDERAYELKRRYNAISENMEGASIAHICTLKGIPMLELRGISNIVEKKDPSKWNKKLASDNCQKALLEIILRL